VPRKSDSCYSASDPQFGDHTYLEAELLHDAPGIAAEAHRLDIQWSGLEMQAEIANTHCIQKSIREIQWTRMSGSGLVIP
jgi:hypothetical protein